MMNDETQVLTFGASWDNKSDVDFLNRNRNTAAAGGGGGGPGARRDTPGVSGSAGSARFNPFEAGAGGVAKSTSKGKATSKNGGKPR